MDAVTFRTEQVMNDSYLNSESVCEGLEKLHHANPDEQIYVVLDNAAYQRCKKVKCKAEELNINLIFLPPYSPNLNLIERLWKFLRKKILANQYYDHFTSFFDAVKSFMESFHLTYSEQIISLFAYHFQCFDSILSG